MTESQKSHNFSVRIITWNVAATSPQSDLRDLLGAKRPVNAADLSDLYAIGYQEVSVNPLNLANEALFEQEWITPVRQILAEFDYVKLISYRLQGLVLAIFVRRSHLLHIRNVFPTCVRTGLLGAWGNKGACIVSLRVYGASMSFTNSHLAAHDYEYKRRLEDYATIVSSAWFGQGSCGLLEHDYVFWFGDLNFRLEERISMDELRSAIQNGTIMNMLVHDQLRRAQQSREAFETMSEGEIRFRPTFKYQIGSSNYKLNARKPAWTDRILYRCNKDSKKEDRNAITLHDYRAHEDYVQSDHKPVSALFSTAVSRDEPIPDQVHFFNITDWNADQGFEVWFCTSTSARLDGSDWIGLVKDKFSSLDEYSSYIWADTRPLSTADRSDPEHPELPTPRNIHRQSFSDQLVILPGKYRLVYFRSKADVLGISDPFKVTRPVNGPTTLPTYYRVSN